MGDRFLGVVDDGRAESPPAAPNLVIAGTVDDDGPQSRDVYDDDDVAYADPRRAEPIVDRIRPLTPRKGDNAARPAVVLAARPVMFRNALDGVESVAARSVEDMAEPDAVIVRPPAAGVG